MSEGPIFVVVCANDKPHPRWGLDPDGAYVEETYVSKATRERANERAALIDAQGRGAARVGRVVFDDEAPA